MGNDPVETVVTEFLVKLTGMHPEGLTIQLVAADEVHLYFTKEAYTRAFVTSLIQAVAFSGADEIDWREDHLRLWWD